MRTRRSVGLPSDEQRPGAAAQANVRRNARAETDRATRWRPARDELWLVLAPLLSRGDRIAVIGAGNADDLPLTRLAASVTEVHLIDVDPVAARRAVRREPRRLRGRISTLEEDVTDGAADRVVADALRGATSPDIQVPGRAIGTGGYDLVLGDLLYTQLLFPALLDAGIEERRRTALLLRHGQALTDGVVCRMHASTTRDVVHVDDVAGWWPGHPQPLTATAVLAGDPAVLSQRLDRPAGADVRGAIAAAGAGVASERWWCWPFSSEVTYLVRATVCAPVR